MKFIIENEEFLDLKDVEDLVGIKQTLIYEKMRYGQFPKPQEKKIEIEKKRKLWKKSDIEEYLKLQKEKK